MHLYKLTQLGTWSRKKYGYVGVSGRFHMATNERKWYLLNYTNAVTVIRRYAKEIQFTIHQFDNNWYDFKNFALPCQKLKLVSQKIEVMSTKKIFVWILPLEVLIIDLFLLDEYFAQVRICFSSNDGKKLAILLKKSMLYPVAPQDKILRVVEQQINTVFEPFHF